MKRGLAILVSTAATAVFIVFFSFLEAWLQIYVNNVILLFICLFLAWCVLDVPLSKLIYLFLIVGAYLSSGFFVFEVLGFRIREIPYLNLLLEYGYCAVILTIIFLMRKRIRRAMDHFVLAGTGLVRITVPFTVTFSNIFLLDIFNTNPAFEAPLSQTYALVIAGKRDQRLQNTA